MEQVARRNITTVAALVAAAGLIAVVPTVTPTLPDVQVRPADLRANVSDVQGSEINALYEHIQHEFGGAGEPILHDVGTGDLLADDGGMGPGGGSPSLNIDELTLDENSVNNLIGAGLDPAVIQEPPIGTIGTADGAAVGGGSASSGLFSFSENAASAVTNFVALSAADSLPMLQAAYQSLTDGLVALELAYNDALVSLQMEAVQQSFGSDNSASDFISWVFSVNNAALAYNETTLNTLLGANFDPDVIHGGLVTALNSEGFTLADWAALFGVSPDDLGQMVSAADATNLLGFLGGVDFASLLPGLF